jgi:hypothetical protein
MANAAEIQVNQFKASPPPILVWDGQQEWQKPRYEIRYFHRRRTEVWTGYVQTKDIKGWVENIRIALFVAKWRRDHGGAQPTNDDILDWMVRDPNLLGDKSREFELGSLAENIVKNGVRQPLVLTSDGVLLDGNRRYFAALMKLREAEKDGDKGTLAMVAYLPAHVLSPTCSEEDRKAVLVEENFVDDCRKRWPSFIRATRVYEDYLELREAGATKGAAVTRLADVFGEKEGQIKRWIKMMDFIDDFHNYHSSEDEETGRVPKDEYEIKWRTQKYFEYFDELSKTDVVNTLTADPELREKVFERLYEGDFVSFTHIRKLPDIAQDRRAKEKFMMGSGPQAVKEAMQWLTVTGMAKKAMDINDRIVSFKQFLESLTAQDIDKLDPEAVSELEDIARKVTSMAVVVHQKPKT